MQMFCVAVAAYTTEITYSNTDSANAAYLICYDNPKALTSGHRICHSLMGAAISSIMVCMVLMIFDVFIPCVDTMVMIISYINTYICYWMAQQYNHSIFDCKV